MLHKWIAVHRAGQRKAWQISGEKGSKKDTGYL